MSVVPVETPIRLNLGAGGVEIPGFVPIDRKFGSEVYPLGAYADGSVEEIRASHILEHFGWSDVPKVLAEWVRVLRVGGRIRIAVPDLEYCAKHIREPIVPRYIMGGQTDADDIHRSAFTPDLLREYMTQAGIVDIKPWTSENTDCAALPVSLNLEGVKADETQREAIRAETAKALAGQTKTATIRACMSIPRVGWNDAWGCIFESLAPFKIPVHRTAGVFWGQCLERALEDAVRDKVEWVLVIDYDSMFNAKNIERLLQTFASRPDIDALAALQARRQSDKYPLMTMGTATRVELDGTPIPVTSAHFGLTLLRMEKLAAMPKPWFWSTPDPSGGWGEGRYDEDIRFWHEWRQAGNTVFVDPDCAIGHLQLMVSEFRTDGSVGHTHVTKWKQNRGWAVDRPEELRDEMKVQQEVGP